MDKDDSIENKEKIDENKMDNNDNNDNKKPKEEEDDDDNNEEIEGFKNEVENEEIKIERLKGDIKTYDRSIKVILIGDSGVGKTNILNRLVNNKFNDKYEPSLSLEYNNHSIKINNYIIRMQIWDTAGQEKYNSIISNYYKSAEVAVFVYSINDIKSYNSIQEWYKELINENNDDNNNVKKILLGNKLDLENERQVEFNTAKSFADENAFEVFAEITCKNDNEQKLYNISNIFDAIGKIFYDEYSQSSGNNLSSFHYFASASILDSKKNPENVIENVEVDKKKKCCCTCF
jgi:Ras-related protein Rab-1A